MTASLPLANKTVLVPREKSQVKRFSAIVEKYGGIPIEVPLLAFKPIAKNLQLTEVLQNIESYNWIIFTSNVAVETFLSFCNDSLLKLPKIAAIGKKTAEFLQAAGLAVDFIPSKYVAEIFAQEFALFVEKGTKLLIPKGNLARDYISNELRKKGAIVDEIIVYETFFPNESKEKLAKLLSENTLDIIPFTSPSTADHFMEIVKEYGLTKHIRNCVFAAIGPIAKKRAESLGLPIHIVPGIYTVEDMIISITEYIEKQALEEF